MKVRLDYVTNSSSSSFILGFANEAAIRKTLEMEQLGKYFGRIYNDCLTATKMNLSEMIECYKSKTKSNTRYFVNTEILDNNLEKYFRMKENGELDKLCNVVIDKRIEKMKEDAENDTVFVMVRYCDNNSLEDGYLEHHVIPSMNCCLATIDHH